MKRALISVSDKTGIVEFAKGLAANGYEIISTGGTLKTFLDAGIAAISVESVTGFAECLDGRVKTLHPAIHGGILAIRDNESHMQHIKELGIAPFDMVVVNLYPFKKTILREDATLEEAIENIDIGGPAMVRSAAKNYKSVAIVTDPSDYAGLLDELKESGEISDKTRTNLCAKAFAHTAAYDALVAEYLGELAGQSIFEKDTLTLTYERAFDLRYGENPHQKAAFYAEIRPENSSLMPLEQLHGKQISFNNINDLHGAVSLLKEFPAPACVCVKHSVPCGVAEAADLHNAFIKACESDPVSIFGGIVALNKTVDLQTALEMNKVFLEIIIAPDYSAEALDELMKKKNLRIIKNPNISAPITSDGRSIDMKKVLGGALIQEIDYTDAAMDKALLKCVTKKQPTEAEMKDLLFAAKVVKHTKSNGIVICKNMQSIGIGTGQVRRSWALEQAIRHGDEIFGGVGDKGVGDEGVGDEGVGDEGVGDEGVGDEGASNGAVMASDAFFPFGDCVELAHKAGITAIIQPGGSLNDGESIELCDKYGIAMVFTGKRGFRH